MDGEFLAWIRQLREKDIQQLEFFKSGKAQVWTQSIGEPKRDATAEYIAELERRIGELDDMLARHSG